MSDTEEIAKAVQEGSKAANTLMNKIADVTGFFFDVRKHAHDAQKSIITEIAQREDINPIERAAIIANYRKAIKHFKNSHNIFEKAIKDLEPNARIDDVDDDWIENFFDKAEKVSKEDIQIVWSRILSNECNEPGSIPKSLLSTLHNLDDKMATVFSNLCGFYCENARAVILPYGDKYNYILEPLGLNYQSFTELQRYGLLTFTNISEFGTDSSTSQQLFFSNKMYILKPKDGRINIGNVLLTNDGQALCRCIFTGCNRKATELAELYWGELIEHEYIKLDDNTYIEVKSKSKG